MRAWIVLGAVAALGTTFGGCISILGDFKVDTSDASVNADVTTTDGDVTDTATDGPSGPECVKSSDCVVPETNPVGCAEAKCVEGECKFLALDKDKDGHRPPLCTIVDKTVETGFDCDDADPTLYPGSVARKCRAANPDGGIATYQEVGVCKLGTQSCTATGDISSCAGAVGPAAEVCGSPNNQLDENCDGSIFEACACTPATTTPCGITDEGACQKGTRTCSNLGVYGPCVGAIDPKPRRCDSKEDNDCNGTVDNKSPTCLCDPFLGSQPCQTGLPGACANGTKACVISPNDPGSSAYSACQGPVPSAERCTYKSEDSNCSGVVGDEASCMNFVRVYYIGRDLCPADDLNAANWSIWATGDITVPTKTNLVHTTRLYQSPDSTDGTISHPIYRCTSTLGGAQMVSYGTICPIKGYTSKLLGYVHDVMGEGWGSVHGVKGTSMMGLFNDADPDFKAACGCSRNCVQYTNDKGSPQYSAD